MKVIKGARMGIMLFQDEVIHREISRCLHSIYRYHPQTHLVEMPGERMKSFEADPEEQHPRILDVDRVSADQRALRRIRIERNYEALITDGTSISIYFSLAALLVAQNYVQ